jgi:hypothetical protein
MNIIDKAHKKYKIVNPIKNKKSHIAIKNKNKKANKKAFLFF